MSPSLTSSEPTPAAVSLAQLAASLPHATVVGDGETRIVGLFQDSRRITPGAIFAVRDGDRVSGRDFVDQALARGAAAILTADRELAESAPVPVLLVENDVRGAIARAAMLAYGDPQSSLTIVGITGTNGKTTTSRLVTSLLSGVGLRAAALGTLGGSFEDTQLPGHHTTPEADDLARTMAVLVSLGATHLTMEVSSHALVLGRVLAVPFRVVAFLNLTHDHLDFHGSLKAYGDAKRLLFRQWPAARAVVNVDDELGADIAGHLEAPVTVSPSGSQGATVRCFASDLTAEGVAALFETPTGRAKVKSALVGAHNLENLAVALGIGVALGLDADKIGPALSAAAAVPGRLERCSDREDDLLVVVDYAHTPDALARVLGALRPLTAGAVWCVFGCGGDRDTGKRPAMGAIAGIGADVVVITNDNPRSEDADVIAHAIVPGVVSAGKTPLVLLDRREAIRHAISSARAGDAVLIAGKGHEPYQIIGDETLPFDDRDEARAALATRRGSLLLAGAAR